MKYPQGFKYLQYFPDKTTAITEVLKIQGSDIVIEMASTRQKVTPSLALQTDEDMNQFIKNNISVNALLLLAKFMPYILKQLILHIVNHDNSLEVKFLKENLAIALVTVDKDKWTGLQRIARYAPDVLNDLIEIMVKDNNSSVDQNIKIKFADALVIQNNMGKATGLHMIAQYAPHALKSLIEYMNKDKSPECQFIKTNFAKALAIKDKDDWSGLHIIARYAPDALKQLVEYMAKDNSSESQYIKTNFANALTIIDNEGRTGLHMIARSAPVVLKDLIEYMAKDNSIEGQHLKINFANALMMQTKEGKSTGLHMIAQYAPQALKPLIEYMTKDNSLEGNAINENFFKAMNIKNKIGMTGLDILNRYAPNIGEELKVFKGSGKRIHEDKEENQSSRNLRLYSNDPVKPEINNIKKTTLKPS